jgi:hypothetical protein
VHCSDKVMSVRDGLPKSKGMPADFRASGETLAE